VWMVGTSSLLLLVAVAFLRNQIRPILRLVRAAEDFGKGRMIEFRPGGAREVRQAGFAFIEMKRRIERSIEQRTTMLNGVSHDLRTILTRFKLSLAFLEEGPDRDAIHADVEEMQRMLEAYLAFARGDTSEPAAPTDMWRLLQDLKRDAERHGHATGIEISGETTATVRPDAFKRCVGNLVANAQRYGDRIALQAMRDARFLIIHVDDDGPGIPFDKREEVFRPFYRLDEARNQDEGGTGLGLAIARDIARAHGGDVSLADSPLGGLRATVRVPV
jgi:two-component system, OmpR family, osmolarity sensor histidine kinase EnvZ